jgi:uncharacterized protein (TIGR03086 family)
MPRRGAVIAAFAGPDVLERMFALPEIGPSVAVPGRQAISFHFIDYVVHGWDVAPRWTGRSSCRPTWWRPPCQWPRRLPDGERRRRPNASFAPRLESPRDADTWSRILALLGRSPEWKP